jgi:hypothetical protein
MNKTTRAELEEAGFEALQRLYALAIDYGDDHGGVAARFLLGLYNGARFPFDLTDLRLLTDEQFDDCMAVLRVDARFTRREVHTYFDRGGRKFEDLVSAWNVVDVERLKNTGDGTAPAAVRRGVLRHGDEVSAKLVTCGNAPGYRDVSLTLDCEVIGERDRVGVVRLDVRLGPKDAVSVMQHVREVNVFAWRQPDRAPLDAQPGERKPSWLE